jgi:hypothetical protein
MVYSESRYGRIRSMLRAWQNRGDGRLERRMEEDWTVGWKDSTRRRCGNTDAVVVDDTLLHIRSTSDTHPHPHSGDSTR